jgi:Domain of unknown function (DUF4157)/A nuclease of the HNH/ENDO VII superfamily with conserved WHH
MAPPEPGRATPARWGEREPATRTTFGRRSRPSPPEGGLPPDLRASVESLAGISLEGVRVHYRSAAPGPLGAHAYTEGDDIHVAPGQEHHLPHEAWHVVQQRQGRVRPNLAFAGHALNADHRLEREADTMGRTASRIQRSSIGLAPEAGDRCATVSRGAVRPVLQGDWVDLAKMGRVDAAQRDPIGALYLYARTQEILVKSYPAQIEELASLVTEDSENTEIRTRVHNFLARSLAEGLWSTPQLLNRVVQEASDVPLGGPDEDHDEDRPDAPEVPVTFENLGELDLSELPLKDPGLINVFVNLAHSCGFKPTTDAYERWYSKRGVWTRSQFAALFEEPGSPMQMARTPGTLSYQSGYTTSSHGAFKDVTYKLDNSGGNINFVSTHKHKTWTNPVDTGSHVNLSKGCTNKEYGLMPSGRLVEIRRGSRSQHFAIANRIKGYDGQGSPAGWTWHHLTTKYHMVLVDRVVHQKHGHNGGVYIW